MPRKPINYANSCIYKIEKEGIVYYVGSTTNFANRKNGHKTTCNNENYKQYHYKIYEFIRNNGGWESFNMILIENYKCNDSNELTSREQHFINEFKTHIMNTRYASRTPKQFYIDNKNEIAITHANYYENNKTEIAIRNAKYRQDNKVEIAITRAKSYENNKVEIAITKAKYYENNKVEIAIRQKNRRIIKENIKLLFKNLPYHI